MSRSDVRIYSRTTLRDRIDSWECHVNHQFTIEQSICGTQAHVTIFQNPFRLTKRINNDDLLINMHVSICMIREVRLNA